MRNDDRCCYWVASDHGDVCGQGAGLEGLVCGWRKGLVMGWRAGVGDGLEGGGWDAGGHGGGFGRVDL